MKSHNQIRRRDNVLNKTSGLRRHKDVSKSTYVLQRLSDACTTLIKIIFSYFVLSEIFRNVFV